MNEIKKKSLLYLGLIFIFYFLNIIFINILGNIYIRYLKPFFIILLLIYFSKKEKTRPQTSLKQLPFLKLTSIIASLSYMLSYIFLGIIDGFGKNPFDTSFRGIITNIISFVPYIVLTEILRDRIINKVRNKRLFLFLIVIVFTLTSISINSYSSLFSNDIEKNTEFLCSEFLPQIIINFTLTQLSIMGGFWTTIWLKLGFEVLIYILPILPNLKWITAAMLKMLFPIFTLLLIQNAISKRDSRDRRRKERKENPVLWIFTYIISIGIVWFSVGIFPIYPTVILTGSMKPVIDPGDIAILEKINSNYKLKVGDIIEYNAGNFFIVHRIINIENNKFKTKGDNNNAPDTELVSFEQIKGRVIFHVPKVGKPVVYIKGSDESLDKVKKQYELGGD